MIEQMMEFLSVNGIFSNPSVWGIGLAVVFGVIWLACYRPPLLTKPWLWAVLAGGAVLAPIAIAVAAFPLRFGVSWLYGTYLSQEDITKWALLLSLPSIYLFGLVREGFKLVPVVVYWWCNGKDIEPRLGLAAGAVSGAGFGILEAQWMLNYIFGSGWSWESVQIQGLIALGGFWESFFILGIQVAACALAGWGLARGQGWKFYLIAACVYLIPAYTLVLVNSELITAVQAEFLVAAWALIATGVVFWLREKKSET
jgi:hypothetical protein